MRFTQPFLFVLLGLLACLSLAAQQPPPRDPQAILVLQQSVAAMGGVVPSDSVATGNIEIVAGSKTESGTIRTLTRGLDQSAEQIQTQEGNRLLVYSRGGAADIQGTSSKSLSFELATSSQSPIFPICLVAAALNSPDSAFQYVGLETLDGLAVHHVRLWKTFLSTPQMRHLAEFTVKDLWFDASSGLPRKLAYDRRAASGAEPRIPLEVLFSDYRNVGGVLFPFRIEKSLNGTPWATITIQNVAFNTGLTEADFPVR